MDKYILGLSCYYFDSAATQEERFSRKKHDSRFPYKAVLFCLKSQNIDLSDVKEVIYYEKPLLTFERLLETYLGAAPRGGRSFVAAMQVGLKEKLFLKTKLKNNLKKIQASFFTESLSIPELLFSEHHLSHAGAAFYSSPFEESVILCIDGLGEWATTSAWIGKGKEIKPLWEISFSHSLGLLYSSFTYYCGFEVVAPFINSIY